MTSFRLSVLLWMILLAGGLRAQLPAETAGLTAEELYRWPGAKPAELQAAFLARYAAATGPETRHDLAKYLARVAYQLSRTDQVNTWQDRVDSLAAFLAEVPYDRGYEMHRISQAYAEGRPKDGLALLAGMRPQMEASGDTLWRLNWLAKRVQGHTRIKDFPAAMEELLVIERLNEAFGDTGILALTEVLHGDLHWEKLEEAQALSRYQQAAAAYEAMDNPRMLLPVYTNLMTVAAKLEEEALAIEYADKLSELRRTYGSDIGYFTGEENKIFFYIQLKQFQAAKKQALHTLRLADSLDRSPAHATYLLGVAYRGIVDYDSAAFHIERAFEMGKQRQHFGQMAFYAHALYQTYYWDERFEPALDWYTTHVQYRDSVYDERKAKEIAVLEAKFETLEQERKVAALEAQAALDRKKRQLLWLAIGLGGLLAGALIYGQRQRAQAQRLTQQAAIDKLEGEKQQLEQELEYKQRELASQMLNMTQKNQLLQAVEAELQPLRAKHPDPALGNLLRLIERHISNDDDWEVFLRSFRALHSNFLDQLKARAESLSANDIRLASLLKMNLSSKEISTLLNITDEGVKKARYRLRKKLQLDSGLSLQDYLVGL